MKATRFSEFAAELASDGDYNAAAVVNFLGALHVAGDKEGIEILSTMAQGIAESITMGETRLEGENLAVEEMARQL